MQTHIPEGTEQFQLLLYKLLVFNIVRIGAPTTAALVGIDHSDSRPVAECCLLTVYKNTKDKIGGVMARSLLQTQADTAAQVPLRAP